MAPLFMTVARRQPTSNLEAVSRSFAAPRVDKHDTRRSSAAAEETTEPEALLEWSYSAKVEVINLMGMGWRIILKDTARPTKTHIERVFNPEDEEQYVDVEVIDEVRVRDEFGRVYTLEILRDPE